MKKTRLAVFVSGTGTNLQAIIDASIPSLDIALVFSNNPDAYAIERARKHGIPCEVLDNKRYGSREEYDAQVLNVIEPYGADLIALAGFMRILSPLFVKAYKNRIVNIHPALLPSFPGINAARQALEAGVKYTGVTVHFVDEGVDTGPIILQSVVPVLDDDTEESLLERLHGEEHKLYPEAIRLVAEDKIRVEGKRVLIKT
ncbi:MAG: phosphoribosylglycinamide formyltransferase [Thermodesulfobacteriota bacterium]